MKTKTKQGLGGQAPFYYVTGMKDMIKKINWRVKFLFGAVWAFALAMLTITGKLGHVIHFSDAMNEMVFFGLMFCIGLFMTVLAIIK